MANDKDGGKKTISLAMFIEDNHKLLSALGILAGLSVFASNLRLAQMGQLLAFFMLSMTVLVWLELMGRYPTPASQRLGWFENFLSFGLLLITFHWLIQCNEVFGPAGIAVVIGGLVLSLLSWALKRSGFFDLGDHPSIKTHSRLRWFVWCAIVAIVLATAYGTLHVGARLAPPVSHFLVKTTHELDSLSTALEKKRDQVAPEE